MPAKKTGSKKKSTAKKKTSTKKKTTTKKKSTVKKPVEKPVVEPKVETKKAEEPKVEKKKVEPKVPFVPWNQPEVFKDGIFGSFKENAFRVSGTKALVEVARKNVCEEPRKVAILHIGSKCYAQLIFPKDETVPIVVTPNGVPSTSDKFDIVVCENMFAHFENVQSALKGALSILGENGLFIAMFPTDQIPNRGKRDFQRFTEKQCKEFFKGMKDVDVIPFGMNKDKPYGYCVSAKR